MHYRKLGKWALKVSEIGFGSWLTLGGSVEEKSSIDMIHHAVSKGINFLDTANVYAHGQAEVCVGKAIQSLKRDDIVLATKVFFPMGDGPNDKGLSRKHVFEQCHASLKRLQTDYIDLYQCHRFDPEVPMEELVRTMDDLCRAGKILYWGVSEWSAQQIESAVNTAISLNAAPPVSNQPFYNMLNREIEGHVIPTAHNLGLGQVVFSPLAQGVLTGKYKPGQPPPPGTRAADPRSNAFMMNRRVMSDEILVQVERLSAIAGDLGISMAQLALAWCLRLPDISSVIIGATKTSQLDDNIKASGIKLPQDICDRIDQILKEPASVSI
jgi:voltage-dependent potassium channel beta subunit